MNESNNTSELEASTDTAIDYSTCYAQTSIQLFNCDNLELMAKMEDVSVDVILTDPPYLYLKNQKLERPFDEQLFFTECKRVLTKNGFIVLFGRGTSFYRWNTILDDLDFVFKEEIIWNKSHGTSPLMPLTRVHETVSIHCKGKGKITKVKVPYLEMRQHDIDSVIADVKRFKTVFSNAKSLEAVKTFLENNLRNTEDEWEANEKTIIRTDRISDPKFTKYGINADKRKSGDRCVNVIQSMEFGLNEKSIIRTSNIDYSYKQGISTSKTMKNTDRCVSIMQSMEFGLNEKSIIKQVRNHYKAIHPTEKPVRILERLLALVIPQDKPKSDVVVLDPFGGSFSTMEAVHNMGMQGIACEIDEEYFNDGKNRIEKLPPIQAKLDLF